MIVERKEFTSKLDLQSFLNTKQSKTYAVYEVKSGQKLQEIVDYEAKKGSIKVIIIIK